MKIVIAIAGAAAAAMAAGIGAYAFIRYCAGELWLDDRTRQQPWEVSKR